jgi:alpha-1,2-mannosyltransferase
VKYEVAEPQSRRGEDVIEAWNQDPTRRASTRVVLSRAALAAAVVYFLAGGVLALWFPANGVDLYVSYAAGAAARSGSSPYEHTVYLETWDRLDPPRAVAESRALPFAYPPSWLPLAMALSLLPWGVALACWKLVSAASVVGIVLLTFRMLPAAELGTGDRRVVFCFALTLSATISVLTIGQSSLFIVFLVALSAVCLERGCVVGSGLALALGAMKPQLAVSYALFLLARGELTVLALAAAGNAALLGLGVYVSGARLDAYLDAAARWAGNPINHPTSEIAVGLASLLGHLTNLNVFALTAIGMAAGVALVAGLAFERGSKARRPLAETLPLLLLAAPLAFRCNSYDLVALIPLFAWARAHGTPKTLGRAIQALCLVLIVPRAALRIAYGKFAAGLVPYDAYYFGETTFRSWILVLLLPLALMAWRARLTAPVPRASA